MSANGDAALDNALDAIEAVYGLKPTTGVNRIEHCTITRPEQIERMAKLGVQPQVWGMKGAPKVQLLEVDVDRLPKVGIWRPIKAGRS
ncbi:amidohydrolase family protein [Mesorhizobium albiziae]